MIQTDFFTYRETTFLDTGALLHAFSIYKNRREFATYLELPNFEKFTFEKCIYEVHMAFRGVGGKKPDEGRGDWAQRHLKGSSEPSTLDRLSSKYHSGNNGLAAYWLNNIQEVMHSLELVAHELPDYQVVLDSEFEKAKNIFSDPNKEELDEILRPVYDLAKEKFKFHDLSSLFHEFLNEAKITTLTYQDVFHTYWRDTTYFTGGIMWHAMNTVVPSEDLEITLCAELVQANLFITSDKRLKTNLYSLGNNSPLNANNVVHVNEFQDWFEKYEANN